MPGSADRWIMLSFATWPNHSRQMPHRNLPTLNAVVSGFSQRGFFKEAFLLFKDMIFCEFRPNSISVASALRGCNSFELCALLHCLSLKIVVVEDVYVATSFFTMYLNCAEVVLAKRVFDEVNNKCVVSYNAYVSGLLRNGLSGLVLDVFKDRMRFPDEKSNSVAFVCVLSACASVLYQKLGMEVHGVVMKTNLCCDTMVGNALTDMCSHVVQFLVLYGKLKWRPMVIPDSYIDHGSPVDRLMQAGLTPSHIAATVFNILVQRREASDITTMHVM